MEGEYVDAAEMDEGLDEEEDIVHPVPLPTTTTCCWLCLHPATPSAKLVQAYLAEHAGAVCPDVMAEEMANIIVLDHPDATGADVSTCLTHLTSHSLVPVVRLASMLRALLDLSDDMRKTLRSYDEEGNPTIDVKLTETFIKLQNQILTVYRQSETNKMLFANRT